MNNKSTRHKSATKIRIENHLLCYHGRLTCSNIRLGNFRDKAKLFEIDLYIKILNNLTAPKLNNLFFRIRNCPISYNLRNSDTDLVLPRPIKD